MALMASAYNGRTDCAIALINAKAEVDARDIVRVR